MHTKKYLQGYFFEQLLLGETVIANNSDNAIELFHLHNYICLVLFAGMIMYYISNFKNVFKIANIAQYILYIKR